MVNRTIARRQFLRGAAAFAALPALQGLGLLSLHGRLYAQPGSGGYGPLVPTPDLRDGVMRIALPVGFQYRSFSHAGELIRRQPGAAGARRHGGLQHVGRTLSPRAEP